MTLTSYKYGPVAPLIGITKQAVSHLFQAIYRGTTTPFRMIVLGVHLVNLPRCFDLFLGLDVDTNAVNMSYFAWGPGQGVQGWFALLLEWLGFGKEKHMEKINTFAVENSLLEGNPP